MKYKVNDRVRIKSIDWYNENKDELGNIDCGDALMTTEKSKFCGNIVTISNVSDVIDAYKIEEDNECYNWTDEMIEGLVEEPFLSAPNITEGVFVHEKDMKWTTEYILPDGYIFKDENGNIINATKIVLEKKSPKTDDIIKWLREHDMTKYIGVLYSGMCSITFDTEGLITDFLKTMEDDE